MSHAPSAAAPAFVPSPQRIRQLRKIHEAGQYLGLALWPALFLGFGLLADRYQRTLPDADLARLSVLASSAPPAEAANIGLPGHLLVLLLAFGLLFGLAAYYANRTAVQTLFDELKN